MDHMEYGQFFYDGKIVNFENALQTDKATLKSVYDKDRLYCPECQIARLRFTSKTSKHRAYLSTWQGDNHPQWCNHAYELASKRQINEYYKTLDSEQITDKLKAAVNAMIRREERNINEKSNGKYDNPLLMQKTERDGTQKRYRLPARSINTMGTTSTGDYDIPILFSGKVLLRVEKRPSNYENSTPFNFLHIYNKVTHKWINRLYRKGNHDNINKNQVYLVSFIAIHKEAPNIPHPKYELYSQTSILYTLCKMNQH